MKFYHSLNIMSAENDKYFKGMLGKLTVYRRDLRE